MTLAPVIIFNYNRPDHSLRTWDALAQNQFASETELYLYCDGPKANASDEMCQRIASLHAQAKQYAVNAPMAGKFKAVHVVCAEKNKGLANSIIGGVIDVINKHGRVIVLEDDLLTSPYFLKYMNEALNKYELYPSVFSISSDIPMRMPSISPYDYDVFASLRFMSYGWGTWKEKWNIVDWNLNNYYDIIHKHAKEFNRSGDDLMQMLTMQKNNQIDSWAVRFQANHFLHHAVSIMPTKSFIHHIGLDGSGTHCGKNMIGDSREINKNSSYKFLDCVYEDARFINAFANCYSRAKRPLWQKAINYIYRKLGINPPFKIKKKIYC